MKRKAAPDAPGETFLFDWTPAREFTLSILGFLVLSLVLHALGFYLFQIVYPPTVSLRPPAAKLYLQQSDTAANPRFSQWIESRDPALVARREVSLETNGPGVLSAGYVPSFASSTPRLRATGWDPPLPPLPDAISSGAALLHPALRAPRRPAGPEPPAATAPASPGPVVQIDGPLRDRLLPGAARATDGLHPPGTGPLESPAFLVAVRPTGAVAHVFLQRSSGNRETDGRVASFLQTLRFSPSPGGEDAVWARVRLDWDPAAGVPSPPHGN